MKNISLLFALAAPAFYVVSDAQANSVPEPVANADYAPVYLAEAMLGQQLFYDPILSGNQVISCATCHHPELGTGDGLSLGIGEGGIGIGPGRKIATNNAPEQRIPRHAQALFNLGAKEFTVLFHDGRIEADPQRPSGLRTPMGEDMMQGFASILSAQTMFPVLSQDEMAGHYSENDVSQAVRQGRITGAGGAWDIIAKRVSEIDAYADQFMAAYSDLAVADDIGFTDISNAIAAFIEWEWRSDTSPFDAYLRGQSPLAPAAEKGRALFYGHAGCSSCHAGPFQTDHQFHATAVPQFGPGKAARFESHARDLGRARVTGNDADAYAFRTPSLRNVALTAPYGHTGSHSDLTQFVTDHADPVAAIDRYQRDWAILPPFDAADWRVMDDPVEVAAISAAVRAPVIRLNADQVSDLVAFLGALTDPIAITGRLGIPETVPSGLPIEPLARP
ncbi:cytochrome-c peroxidase [Thalassobium sp. R2A62]|jgi:cytochrome c peroxidase|uniref:cytochrome-c peroxidase n=1 Tax=Thalassobium sp. R2A62 TaxID=633131 RepID=UPI0001B1D79F|nr:cytochrome c peroxidase [Thalassobium sp. R2A62]EET49714.1 Di-heme cytochrome c peroxidase [Thalassobium sp. R2A62]